MSFIVGAAVVMTACDSDDSRDFRLAEYFESEEFLNGETIPEQGVTGAWVCEFGKGLDLTPSVNAGPDDFEQVALRFYRDGSLIIGLGEDEMRSRWRVDGSVDGSDAFLSFPLSERWMPLMFADVDSDSERVVHRIHNVKIPGNRFVAESFRLGNGERLNSDADTFRFYDGYHGSLYCDVFDSRGRRVDAEGDEPQTSSAFDPQALGLEPAVVESDTSHTSATDSDSVTDDSSGGESTDEDPNDSSIPESTDEGDSNDEPPVADGASATPERPQNDPESAPNESSGDLSPDLGIDGLRRLWYVGRLAFTVNGLSPQFLAILEFDNGSITTDIDTVVASGTAASRRSNPDQWGTSRVVDGQLLFRFDDTGMDVETEFTVPAIPGGNDERLDGCFGRSRGFSSGGVASISLNTLCFDRTGRFSNDRAVATSNPSGSGSANSEVTGRYRIDGQSIQLAYDDGKRLRTTFGYYGESGRIETVLIGERVLDR